MTRRDAILEKVASMGLHAALFGVPGAAVAAPSGNRLRAAGHTAAGSALGALAGLSSGAILGAASGGGDPFRTIFNTYRGGRAGMIAGSMTGAGVAAHRLEKKIEQEALMRKLKIGGGAAAGLGALALAYKALKNKNNK